MPGRVTGKMKDPDSPFGPKPEGLATTQAHIYRGVASELPSDPISRFLVGAEAVGLGPEVDLRHYPLVALYPGPVGLATREPESRVHLLEGAVAAAVVDVGVAYDDLGHVFDAEADPLHVRNDDLLRCTRQACVYEDRPLFPHQQVLAHEPLAEVGLDAVDVRQYLHLPPLRARGGAPTPRRARRRPRARRVPGLPYPPSPARRRRSPPRRRPGR